MNLIQSYNPKVYESLGDIEVVHKLISEDEIKKAGKIIIKHGLENRVNLIIAHRHFDLLSEEVMLEQDIGQKRVSKPVMIQDISGDMSFPNMLFFQEGCWYPVSYGLKNDSQNHVWSQEFLQDMGQFFSKNVLTEKFLLGLRSPNPNKEVFIEHNYPKTRMSEVVPLKLHPESKILEKTIPTTYNFCSDSNGLVEVTCEVVCALSFE